MTRDAGHGRAGGPPPPTAMASRCDTCPCRVLQCGCRAASRTTVEKSVAKIVSTSCISRTSDTETAHDGCVHVLPHVDREDAMRLVVFGLTVSSSWGNGHAT